MNHTSRISILFGTICCLCSCTPPDYLRKVTVVDDQGSPIKGVERLPRSKFFGYGEFSNRKGKIYTMKGGQGIFIKDGYIPLRIKQDSTASVYTLYKNSNNRLWDICEIVDIEPSQ